MEKEGSITLFDLDDHFINVKFKLDGEDHYRLTGYNGHADRSTRSQFWDLLTNLASQPDMPWCILGDFNDLLKSSEKIGWANYPRILIEGFNKVIKDCNLADLGYVGTHFTWERS